MSIFNQLPDLGAKEAALRVLGTNPKSQDLFANLLKDKNQPLSLRTLSATGLHLLNPQKFADIAQQIVRDHSDSEDIRASSLGALANTLTDHVLQTNSNFQNLVRQLGADNSLQNLSAAARRMLAKLYGTSMSSFDGVTPLADMFAAVDRLRACRVPATISPISYPNNRRSTRAGPAATPKDCAAMCWRVSSRPGSPKPPWRS